MSVVYIYLINRNFKSIFYFFSCFFLFSFLGLSGDFTFLFFISFSFLSFFADFLSALIPIFSSSFFTSSEEAFFFILTTLSRNSKCFKLHFFLLTLPSFKK